MKNTENRWNRIVSYASWALFISAICHLLL